MSDRPPARPPAPSGRASAPRLDATAQAGARAGAAYREQALAYLRALTRRESAARRPSPALRRALLRVIEDLEARW